MTWPRWPGSLFVHGTQPEPVVDDDNDGGDDDEDDDDDDGDGGGGLGGFSWRRLQTGQTGREAG